MTRIKSEAPGHHLTKPKQISESFADFYRSLYKITDTASCETEIESFLDQITLSKLSEIAVQELDSPIIESEVRQAIVDSKCNKSPGPDGYNNEFYKKIIDTVSPILTQTYNSVLETGYLPPSWRDAYITVIHKEGKDPTDCSSYRPISLLNCDQKFLTSILSRRLNTCITQIVHPDQTGFIPGRYSGNNVRRLLNIMNHVKVGGEEAIILSLDAEKAFDRLSWKFLYQTLTRMGFGPNFIKWIRTLYSEPRAAIRVNGYTSDYFSLERGTRQGDPLSPALFAICMEPLAQIIRDNKRYWEFGQVRKNIKYPFMQTMCSYSYQVRLPPYQSY